MKNDSAILQAYSPSIWSQISSVLCFVILLPTILFLNLPWIGGLALFVLAFLMSLFLYGRHFRFDRQTRQIRVTRAWFYWFRTSSSVFDFNDVQSIEIARRYPAGDEVQLKMLHRTYYFNALDVDRFFLRLCQFFPQFTPPAPRTSQTDYQETPSTQ
ncbi:hypothetical protein Pan153_56860 [Gimesia panareensis]|uniref:Uncharacterized protein n=1 Tax=Gimesia panareensis TaxID=2527978 RepID=A0A518FXJ0_9PLAN|nr:DUF4175 domain-containing protein [Gimesia panareensis]QDV21004.1 hypothetical protein Pan153_56860 [Gimesia panareensis]